MSDLTEQDQQNRVRLDIGGWLSGPCLPAPADEIEFARWLAGQIHRVATAGLPDDDDETTGLKDECTTVAVMAVALFQAMIGATR